MAIIARGDIAVGGFGVLEKKAPWQPAAAPANPIE